MIILIFKKILYQMVVFLHIFTFPFKNECKISYDTLVIKDRFKLKKDINLFFPF